jgi:pilus assembly protein CpaF
MEGDMIVMQEIFKYERSGIGQDGRVVGRHKATGVRPQFAERLKIHGMPLPADLFRES